MLYSLTEKLTFAEDPQIEVKGKVLTIKSDAETVLKLLDVIQNESQIDGAKATIDMLLSEKDKKVFKSLNLNIADWRTFTETMVALALGNDPDAEAQGEE